MKNAPPSRESLLKRVAKERYQFDFRRDVPDALKADAEIVLAVAAHGRVEWEDVPTALHDDRRVCMVFAKRGWDGLAAVPERWRDDREFVLEVLADEPGNFRHASERLRADREVALLAVAMTQANNLEHVSARLLGDRDLVLAAVRDGHRQAYMYVPEALRSDPEILALAIERCDGGSCVVERFPAATRDDTTIALRLVARNGWALRYYSERVRDDEEVVRTAMLQDIRAVETASPRLRADLGIARLVATSEDCRQAFRYLAPEARNHPEIVALAVPNGAELADLDARWQDDEPTVRAAVTRWGRNYGAASERLKADRAIALLAAQDHRRGNTWGFQLAWVPEPLRGDREIAEHAVRSVHENAKDLPPSLLADEAFLRGLLAVDDGILEYLPEATQRVLALATVTTGAYRGRHLDVALVPGAGHVYNQARTLEHVAVVDAAGARLTVTDVPVVTYEDDGPCGSYLTVRFVNMLVLCGDYVFLVQRNSGFDTTTSLAANEGLAPEVAAERRHLWHHVWLVPWRAQDGSRSVTFEALRDMSVLLYEGAVAHEPVGVSAFDGSADYDTAVSILGGADAKASKFKREGERGLTLAAGDPCALAGAARVYVGEWRWLLPNAEGPHAAFGRLSTTGDADDWAWLSTHVADATPTERARVRAHFAGGALEAEVAAACAGA